MQGEGQEFESPRLHHFSAGKSKPGEPTAPNAVRTGEYRVDPGSDSQGSRLSRLTARELSSRRCVSRGWSPDQWSRAPQPFEVTDQRIAGGPGNWAGPVKGARTLTSEDVIGNQVFFELRFLPKITTRSKIPILALNLPMGELLSEVKLHRARGGCLGAKSR